MTLLKDERQIDEALDQLVSIEERLTDVAYDLAAADAGSARDAALARLREIVDEHRTAIEHATHVGALEVEASP